MKHTHIHADDADLSEEKTSKVKHGENDEIRSNQYVVHEPCINKYDVCETSTLIKGKGDVSAKYQLPNKLGGFSHLTGNNNNGNNQNNGNYLKKKNANSNSNTNSNSNNNNKKSKKKKKTSKSKNDKNESSNVQNNNNRIIFNNYDNNGNNNSNYSNRNHWN